MNYFNSFEIDLLHNLQDAVQCSFLDWLMPMITALGNAGIFWIILAAVLLCFKKTRKIGLTMGISIALGFLIGNLTLKPLIGRIRPYDYDTAIALLIPPEGDFSFPSGHTLASFEGAVSVFIYNKRFGIAALLLAGLIAFSRLYLMVHYPLDITAGILLGIIFAMIAAKITDRIYCKAGSDVLIKN